MATLTLLAPPGAGFRCEIPNAGCLLLGRDSQCDIVLGQRALSRKHAKVFALDGEYLVEDLQSTNGTYLNGRRIHRPTRLQDGDVINLHDVPLAFSLDGADGTPITEDTFKLPALETLARRETDEVLPVYPGTPGASILRGRLNSLIQIVRQIGSDLDPEQLPPRVLDLLFRMFPQTELGAVLLAGTDGQLSMVAERNGSASASAISRHSGHAVPELAREVWLSGQGVLQSHAATDNESVLNDESITRICLPIVGVTASGLGSLLLETRDVAHAFTRDDLELAGAVGVLAGQALEFTRAHEILREADQTQHHLETARAIQLGMLPRQQPDLPGYAFAEYYSPAQAVGGDYYFWEQLAGDRLLLGIADASGKGLGAAMTIARFAGEVRARLITARTLKQAMADLNEFVLSCGTATFITCCVCILDARQRVATIATAGHMLPLCRRAGSYRIERWTQAGSGLPFGIDPDFTCHPVKYTLDPGDVLLMYTDGVTEAMNPAHDLFGAERLDEAFLAAPPDVSGVLDHIVGAVNRFRAGELPSDDTSLLAIQQLAT